MQPSGDPDPLATARHLAWWFVGMVVFWVIMAVLLMGCSTPQPTPSVNVQPAIERVDRAVQLGTDARGEVRLALAEVSKPDPNLDTAKLRLRNADALLVKQQESLRAAQHDLAEAHKAAALSAKQVEKLKRESEKYRLRYEALKKYRWAVLIISGWIVIKFLGSIGAWSAHGRIARFLIG